MNFFVKNIHKFFQSKMSINKPLSGLGWRMKLFMKIQK